MICVGDSRLVNIEHVLRDSDVQCYIIGKALHVLDATLHVIEDNHSQIYLALIQWAKSKLLFNETINDIILFV